MLRQRDAGRPPGLLLLSGNVSGFLSPHREQPGVIEGIPWAAPEWILSNFGIFYVLHVRDGASGRDGHRNNQERITPAKSNQELRMQSAGVYPSLLQREIWTSRKERNMVSRNTISHNTTSCFFHSGSCWEGHSVSKCGRLLPFQICIQMGR